MLAPLLVLLLAGRAAAPLGFGSEPRATDGLDLVRRPLTPLEAGYHSSVFSQTNLTITPWVSLGLECMTWRSTFIRRDEAEDLQVEDQAAPASRNLCSRRWVLLLSSSRAGSTSIMEALDALLDLQLGGEKQASLEAASVLLGRRLYGALGNPPTKNYAK